MARYPLLEEALQEDADAEAEAEEGGSSPRPASGPRVRVGASGASSGSKSRKRGASTTRTHKAPSGGSQRATGASTAKRSHHAIKADPLTEWVGEGLAALLQVVSIKATAGQGALQRAEALGIAKPAMRLVRRNLLPATIIDIDMPSEDKRDISLLIATLGRYLGRLLERKLRPSPEQLQAMYQARMRAEMAGGVAPSSSASPRATADAAEAGGSLDVDDFAMDSAQLAALLGVDAGGGSSPSAEADTADTRVGGGGPPGAEPGAFTRMMAAGVLPGYTGEE